MRIDRTWSSKPRLVVISSSGSAGRVWRLVSGTAAAILYFNQNSEAVKPCKSLDTCVLELLLMDFGADSKQCEQVQLIFRLHLVVQQVHRSDERRLADLISPT